MERKLKDYAFIALKGMGMGAADVVPGVSGGTIAFIVGIYDELIETPPVFYRKMGTVLEENQWEFSVLTSAGNWH